MLNTNMFGRPYDDLNQDRILKEAINSFHIFLLSVAKFIIIKSSDVLFAEITLIRDESKRELILSLINKVCKERVRLNNKIIKLANDIYPIIKDYMDSLHVAFAIDGNCTYFITCDDEILRSREEIANGIASPNFILF